MDTLATLLNRYCPSGVGSRGVVRVGLPELDRILREGARWALKNGFASENDLARTEEQGCIEGANPAKVSERAKQRGKEQIGSLGAGNHFIEVDLVEQIFDNEAASIMGLQQGCLAIQIHCGSRGLGHQICTDYVQEFQGAVKRYGIELPDRELVCAPMDSPEGQAYLGAMKAAANFAFANRQLLAYSARRAFEEAFAGKGRGWELVQVYDIAHNMGKIETHILRGQIGKSMRSPQRCDTRIWTWLRRTANGIQADRAACACTRQHGYRILRLNGDRGEHDEVVGFLLSWSRQAHEPASSKARNSR